MVLDIYGRQIFLLQGKNYKEMLPKLTFSFLLIQLLFFSNGNAQNINTIVGGIGDHGVDTLAELYRPNSVIADKWGNIYIADGGNNVVRKVDTNGIITAYAGTCNAGGFSGDNGPAVFALLNTPAGLAIDTFGNLFIADQGNKRIREVNAGGIITTYAGIGMGFATDTNGTPAKVAHIRKPAGIALDKVGNLYIADIGNNVIRKVNTLGKIYTVAGNGTAGFHGDNGHADTSEINAPAGVCIDNKGNLFIADQGNYRIRKVDTFGVITTFAGNGIVGYSGDGSVAIGAEFNILSGISSDSIGDIYISDAGNDYIRKIDTSGIIIRFAGRLLSGGFSGDGGLDTSAKLNDPAGTAFDKHGNFYIADNLNNRVRMVNTAGNIYTFAGCNSYTSTGYKGDGGSALLAQLSGPTGFAYDTAQNLYIADRGNHVVRMINSAGIISTVAGDDTSGYTGDGGPATSAKMVSPYSVATDRKGNLFICDPGKNVVRKVNSAGIISTYAGSGVAGFSGDGGLADTARLSSPTAIATDKYGNLYIADEANNRIREVDTSQVITTIAGTDIASFFGDGGPAILAEFNQPDGICTDTEGNIYISDKNNYRIRKIDAALNISTVVGNGIGGYSGDGTAAIFSSINAPMGITTDKFGNLYIEESNYIRKVNSAGIISTVAGNGAVGFYGDGQAAILAAISESVNAGMVTDTSGNLLIPDFGNNRVREIFNARITISTASDTVCTGDPVATFTATATSASVYVPLYYHWLRNSLPVGTNSPTYTATGITTGDQVTCYVSHGASAMNLATSNQITMAVITHTASVTFVASPPGALCGPTPVVCTPHPVNGGATPIYDWYKNGVHVLTAPTYSLTPVNGDSVRCKLTSNAICLAHDTAWSTFNIFSVTTIATPVLTVTVNPVGTVCEGTQVTCRAHQTGIAGGATYSWYKNDTLVNTSATYVFTPLNGDVVYCKVSGSGICGPSDTATVLLNTFHVIPATLIPSVTVTISPGIVCAGTPVICTPHPVNGGTTPIYRWYKNDTLESVGGTYSFAPLNGDKIYCKLYSDATCLLIDSAVSGTDTITLSVPSLLPSVSVVVNPGDTVCLGTDVTCTPMPINGGSSPLYNWYKNGVFVHNGSPYTFAPADNDVVYCKLTSNTTCVITDTAVSHADTFKANTPAAASVSISLSPGDTVCPGTSVTCTAIPVNGGDLPTYEWYKNSLPVFSGNTYNFVPNNNDKVYCILTSSIECVNPKNVASQLTQFKVQNAMPDVSINIDPGNAVCPGTVVTCTANGVNGGTSPIYDWYLNGNKVYTGKVYSFSPNGGDRIYCSLTSNAECASPLSANSAQTIFHIDSVPVVAITSQPGPIIFSGTNVTFTASVFGGSGPFTFKWMINGVAVSTGSSNTYTTNNFSLWDSVSCEVTSPNGCTYGANSNSLLIDTYHDMRLYPNPTNGNFVVNGNDDLANGDEVDIKIYNTAGKMVYKKKSAFNGITFYSDIDLGREMPPGVYLLRLEYNNKKISLVFSVSY